MKNLILMFAFSLSLSFSILGQVKLEIVKNARSTNDLRLKSPDHSFIGTKRNQSNLVNLGLNDVNLSFRTNRAALKPNLYCVQVFEHINYTGNYDMFALPVHITKDNYWADKISSFRFFERQVSPQFGGNGGAYFGAVPALNQRIKIINIWAGDLVDAIQFVWTDQQGNQETGKKHGGPGGTLYSITLENEEYITVVGGAAGAHLDAINFRTSHGRVLSVGGKGGEPFEANFGNKGGFFQGLDGRAGLFIDAIKLVGFNNQLGTVMLN